MENGVVANGAFLSPWAGKMRQRSQGLRSIIGLRRDNDEITVPQSGNHFKPV